VIDGVVWHLFCANQGGSGGEWCAKYAKIGFETRGAWLFEKVGC
jgi:hypothetical protein